MDTSLVTRVEVIDGGRAYVARGAHSIVLSLQDDGRTLKVFVNMLAAIKAENYHG